MSLLIILESERIVTLGAIIPTGEETIIFSVIQGLPAVFDFRCGSCGGRADFWCRPALCVQHKV